MARRGRSPGLTGGPGHPDNARVRAWMTLCVASTFGTLSRHPVCNIPSATVWRNWMASICGPRQLFFVVISLPLPLRPKREKVGECGADALKLSRERSRVAVEHGPRAVREEARE